MGPVTIAAILIGTAVVGGGVIGWFSADNENTKQENTYNLQQERIETKKIIAKDNYVNQWGGTLSDGTSVKGTKQEEYDLQKGEAFKQADIQDEKISLDEGYLGSEYNNALFQLGLAQRSQGLENESTALNIASSTGNDLAMQAVSGTRGSSVMGALERQQAYNQSAFAQNRNIAEMNLNQQLTSSILGLNKNKDMISYNRAEINKGRTDWEAGGYNYESFQLAKKENDLSWKSTERLYNLQKEYNEKYYDINKMNGWDYTSYVFNGMTSGLSLSISAKNLWDSF